MCVVGNSFSSSVVLNREEEQVLYNVGSLFDKSRSAHNLKSPSNCNWLKNASCVWGSAEARASRRSGSICCCCCDDEPPFCDKENSDGSSRLVLFENKPNFGSINEANVLESRADDELSSKSCSIEVDIASSKRLRTGRADIFVGQSSDDVSVVSIGDEVLGRPGVLVGDEPFFARLRGLYL